MQFIELETLALFGVFTDNKCLLEYIIQVRNFCNNFLAARTDEKYTQYLQEVLMAHIAKLRAPIFPAIKTYMFIQNLFVYNGPTKADIYFPSVYMYILTVVYFCRYVDIYTYGSASFGVILC